LRHPLKGESWGINGGSRESEWQEDCCRMGIWCQSRILDIGTFRPHFFSNQFASAEECHGVNEIRICFQCSSDILCGARKESDKFVIDENADIEWKVDKAAWCPCSWGS
jgi:hypothetical protein